MGDVIHALPALTDAKKNQPDLTFDWVVEKSFAEIPKWHLAVNRVIEIEFRKWRKIPLKAFQEGQWQAFYRALTQETYDYVIDAQGLLKSAFFTLLAKGKRFGFDKHSAREPYAALFYQKSIAVSKNLHAVTRLRQLFAQIFGYTCPEGLPDYGIIQNGFLQNSAPLVSTPYVVFLHGTTWETKLWPVAYWQELGHLLTQQGMSVYLPWGNLVEKERAEAIAGTHQKIHVLPTMSLSELAVLLAKANAVVSVDTGLAHLAAALAVPTYSIYGPTNPSLTGTLGLHQHHLNARFSCAPCLQKVCTYKGASVVTPACFGEITPQMLSAIVASQIQAKQV